MNQNPGGVKNRLTLFMDGPLPNTVQIKGKGGHLNKVHIIANFLIYYLCVLGDLVKCLSMQEQII